jgi:alpha-glucuronidase
VRKDLRLLLKTSTAIALRLASSLGFSSFASLASLPRSSERLATDEDGYRAWLRYHEIDDVALKQNYQENISNIVVDSNSATAQIVRNELVNGLSAMLGTTVPFSSVVLAGSIVVVTSKSSLLAQLLPEANFTTLGFEGFSVQSIRVGQGNAILIAAQTDVGTLYGAFAFLRLLQTGQSIDQLSIQETPKNPLRLLAHWANSDGTIERGYAGNSLWNWDDLPERVDERLIDYARLNASIGINGFVLNCVNADPAILDVANLRKVAALADIFRPYGIKVYLCPNFDAPCTLSNLPTADPLDPDVIHWWEMKAIEIYYRIRDFGGFLVKANSEGMPGPQNYDRTHADGANCLANSLAPFGGIVIWRAFVYTDGNQDPDRVKRAGIECHPLDGHFASNVLLGVKNGPLDFQPREPFHPLFGAIPNTRVMGELQITQEYLGQATHLVYLGPAYKEFLDANTYANGKNSSVAQIIQSLPKPGSGGMFAGANTGSDRNWCGHHFAQANWFAFGRLAWNSDLTAAAIAEEWIKMTWSTAQSVVECILDIMMQSYEAYVSYTMPLGLHHMVGGDHYAPLPEGEEDPRGIFHHAGCDGIGYDRTRGGSGYVDQYQWPLNERFNDPATCPEKYLLWFHHLPWSYLLRSGRTLWKELCFKYQSGVKAAQKMEKQWASLEAAIDSRRHKEVSGKLHQQAKDARAWSNICLSYFSESRQFKPWSVRIELPGFAADLAMQQRHFRELRPHLDGTVVRDQD